MMERPSLTSSLSSSTAHSTSPLTRSPESNGRRYMNDDIEKTITPANSSTISMNDFNQINLNVQASSWIPEKNRSASSSYEKSSILGTTELESHIEGRIRDIEAHIGINTIKNSWICRLCRKTFKQRKDIEQHLHSGTHDDVKYICKECGKGFTSLGSITLHIEQAGHPNKHILLQEVHTMATDNVFGISTNSFPTSSEKAFSSISNKYGIIMSSVSPSSGHDIDSYDGGYSTHDFNIESFRNLRINTTEIIGDGRLTSRTNTPLESPRYSFNQPRSAMNSNKSTVSVLTASQKSSQKSNLFSPGTHNDDIHSAYQSNSFYHSGHLKSTSNVVTPASGPHNRFALNFESLHGTDALTPLSTLSSRAQHMRTSPRATMRTIDSYKSGETDFSPRSSLESARPTPMSWQGQPSQSPFNHQQMLLQQQQHQHQRDQLQYQQEQQRHLHDQQYQQQYRIQQQQQQQQQFNTTNFSYSKNTPSIYSPRSEVRQESPRVDRHEYTSSTRTPLDPLERAIFNLTDDNTTPRTPPGLSVESAPLSNTFANINGDKYSNW